MNYQNNQMMHTMMQPMQSAPRPGMPQAPGGQQFGVMGGPQFNPMQGGFNPMGGMQHAAMQGYNSMNPTGGFMMQQAPMTRNWHQQMPQLRPMNGPDMERQQQEMQRQQQERQRQQQNAMQRQPLRPQGLLGYAGRGRGMPQAAIHNPYGTFT